MTQHPGKGILIRLMRQAVKCGYPDGAFFALNTELMELVGDEWKTIYTRITGREVTPSVTPQMIPWKM